MKTGAEDKKKLWLLIALGVVAAYFFYSNVLSGPSGGPSPGATASVPAADLPEPGEPPLSPAAVRAPATRQSDVFHPVLRSARKEEQINVLTVDPTLRLDLLAKLQQVPAAGNGRNLFDLGKPPITKIADAEPVVRPFTPIGPRRPAPKPADAGPPQPPPPPPIALKYYGIVQQLDNGKKTACFLDGEEILVETEGETFKGRYRLVKIGVNSATIEDTQSKRQQTIPLAEEAQG